MGPFLLQCGAMPLLEEERERGRRLLNMLKTSSCAVPGPGQADTFIPCCGALSKNDPHRLIYLNAYSQGVAPFEKSRRKRRCSLIVALCCFSSAVSATMVPHSPDMMIMD